MRSRSVTSDGLLIEEQAASRVHFKLMMPWLLLSALAGYIVGWGQWSGYFDLNALSAVTTEMILGSIPLPSAKFFEYAANLFNSCFYLSPMVQMAKVYSSKGAELGNVNSQTIILMLFNCTMWGIWGVYAPMWPAVPGNVIGASAATCYLTFCWGYVVFGRCFTPRWGLGAAVGTAVAIILLFIFAAYAQASTEQAQQVGFLAMFICIALYASPLSEVKQVIEDKSSELLPPTQCFMQFVNCALWLVVGTNSRSVQVLVCNGLGFALATVQLGLIAMFPSVKEEKDLLP